MKYIPAKIINGNFVVCSDGTIFNIKYKGKLGSIHIVPQRDNGNGYMKVNLGHKSYYVHRLVAEAFISNPNNLPQVNHKDENKKNNSVDNLEWCDAKYNSNYGTKIERFIEKNTNGKKSKKVYQYTIDGELVNEWKSTMDVQRTLGYKNSCISSCCRKTKYNHTYKGFVWSYEKL